MPQVVQQEPTNRADCDACNHDRPCVGMAETVLDVTCRGDEIRPGSRPHDRTDNGTANPHRTSVPSSQAGAESRLTLLLQRRCKPSHRCELQEQLAALGASVTTCAL